MMKFSNFKFQISNNIAQNRLTLSRGFTVVELLVTIFVFSIVALTTAAIFVKSLEVERRALGAQVIQENILAVFELISKDIRVSTVSNQNNNCTTDPVLNTLTINHPIDGIVTYQLNTSSGIVEKVVSPFTYLISSKDVIFNNLRFCVSGSVLPADDLSSRVTIIASVTNILGSKPITINTQITVTTRDLTNEFQN